ncbi:MULTISPECIES: DUF1161 domain-containing protein [unclassified Undibacterium]|uniref:DUF1161 domain-containing protein n=1 Tax=unclassified Undibacterium TaxID=2630295 RepID=UPI002AC9D5DA|nr:MULTISPECIES: DUF1161 domain-containing protein [unclassified Undibacterium]MEB0140600.1 DUF1161 domain-containing protein [Undibacterium sp. CCC2.1]MEB0173494.1 DUF1161 domain-containing protein [Undibacterium sp. CCC1.1]MEB0177604.1 DUF1161 domain-containing protein [Undibacterium sp. CCC3.4]MEB0216778.1 DUF1161 domain-containing protein [Undibacterium sp. 5I2]WPX44672.1 DUF1161 domain-containing protein [Undibacterium sp. CCC3.4]
MNNRVLVQYLGMGLMLCSASVWAAVTPCDTIIEKIDMKLEHKDVKNYSLKVIDKNTETKLRVVGVCEGGEKKIVYQKTKSAKSPEASKAAD